MSQAFKNKEKSIRTILIISVLLYVFLTMFYMDLDTTIQISQVWIQSMFDGKYASFYNNALNANIVSEGAVYDIGIYAVFGVWGIPVWILNKLLGVSVRSVGSFLWFKLLLCICLGITSKSICNIAKKLGVYDEELPYQLATMMIYVVPVVAVAQYDIIPLMLAVRAIDRGIDELDNKSIGLFAISFIMKPFTMLIFGLFLLIKEKRISRIVSKGILSMVPFIICKLIYAVSSVNQATNNAFLDSRFNKLINFTAQDAHGEISIFFCILLASCLVAYCWNNKETSIKGFIIVSTIMWLGFCLFTPAYPYWVIYLSPFLILTARLVGDRYRNVGYMLELVVELILFIVLTIPYSWVFGGSYTMSYLILKKIHESKTEVVSVYNIMQRFGINRYEPIVHAALIVSCIGLIVLSLVSLSNDNEKMEENNKVYSCVNWVRLVIFGAWTMLCTALLIVAA